eukprot:CAMPEP_0184520986 /NCGR_PEP_ID=MMETSP0198_2-20121128/7468_1 /TAXON_ID=1112570 /ORGANISM="Thraustochytrium sp., Strain LLF1b" /LENGTH=901 /DNA_ID=CAMNT_0026911637 /DNA_START=38 /DNA_END=2743 /DNA_ORIENTATION=+
MYVRASVAALTALIAAVLPDCTQGLDVWARVPAKIQPTNERLAAVPYTTVAVDHEELVAELAKDSPTLEFELLGRTLTCTVKPSGVMHPDLAAKFPTIKSLSGSCRDGSDVSLNIDTAAVGSLEATLYTSEGNMYADALADGIYMLYSQADAKTKGAAPGIEFFGSSADQNGTRKLEASLLGERNKLRQTLSEATGYKLRLAILTSREYGAFHGGTIESTMLAIVNTVVRVNGIFIRELGVLFELIAENDKLLCLQSDTTCDHWPNDVTLRDQNEALMLERNVTSNMYDIGHSLSTSNSFSAISSTLCSSSKASSSIGFYSPNGDLHWTEINAFVLGLKLAGSLTYRDCNGVDVGSQPRDSAVEPGGGVTLMGLIGECGANNVQSNRDSHFNSINLEQMRAFIETQVADGCGEAFATGKDRPVVSTQAGLCVVPKGNFVQLSGRVENMDPTTVTYAWDRVDPGFKRYTDVNVPRFRPWSPGPSPSRFLPNMYYLTYGLGTQLGEIPPKASVPGDDEMTFRFVARTKSQSDLGQSPFDIGPVGAFDFKDVEVHYKSSEEPLMITSQLTELVVGNEVDITWTGGTLSGYVEILLAVNTMFEAFNFRYELDLKDLEWVSVASVPNNGSATITVPQLTSSLFQQVNLMIRSTGNEDCYFFDLVPRLTFVGGTSETASPTVPTLSIPTVSLSPTVAAPTAAPTTSTPTTAAPTTLTPTVGPTENPTNSPTLSPTAGPSISPTSGPTLSPTAGPTISPTSGPTVSPTAGPTVSPTAGPTRTPTAGPTISPTAGPTKIPTNSPTLSPSAGPTMSPTEAPATAALLTNSPTTETPLPLPPTSAASETMSPTTSAISRSSESPKLSTLIAATCAGVLFIGVFMGLFLMKKKALQQLESASTSSDRGSSMI